MSRKLTVVALCLSLAVGCSQDSQETPTAPQSSPALVSVKLTCSKNLWATLPLCAKDKAFFEAEGLSVQIQFVNAAKFAMDNLVADKTHFAAVVEVNVAYLGFTGNRDIAVVAQVVESYDGAIVVRGDAGVRKPSDLGRGGIRLGVMKGTTSEFFADNFLRKHGVSLDTVDIRPLQPVAMQTAIIEKGIDAASLWQPFIYNISGQLAKKNNQAAVVFNDRKVYTGYMNLAVRRDWAAQNRSTVVAFLRALRRAEGFVAAEPDAAQVLMASSINVDLPIVKAIWEQYSFKLAFDPVALTKVIQAQGQWITETQNAFRSKPVPNYSSYFDGSFFKDFSGP